MQKMHLILLVMLLCASNISMNCEAPLDATLNEPEKKFYYMDNNGKLGRQANVESEKIKILMEEINKLKDLLQTLRDQQYIIKLLDDKDALFQSVNDKRNATSNQKYTSFVDEKFPSNIEEETSEKTINQPSKSSGNAPNESAVITEINNLRKDLNNLNNILNRAPLTSIKNISVAELDRKLKLKLEHQNEELKVFKDLFSKIRNNQTNGHSTITNSSEEEIATENFINPKLKQLHYFSSQDENKNEVSEPIVGAPYLTHFNGHNSLNGSSTSDLEMKPDNMNPENFSRPYSFLRSRNAKVPFDNQGTIAIMGKRIQDALKKESKQKIKISIDHGKNFSITNTSKTHHNVHTQKHQQLEQETHRQENKNQPKVPFDQQETLAINSKRVKDQQKQKIYEEKHIDIQEKLLPNQTQPEIKQENMPKAPFDQQESLAKFNKQIIDQKQQQQKGQQEDDEKLPHQNQTQEIKSQQGSKQQQEITVHQETQQQIPNTPFDQQEGLAVYNKQMKQNQGNLPEEKNQTQQIQQLNITDQKQETHTQELPKSPYDQQGSLATISKQIKQKQEQTNQKSQQQIPKQDEAQQHISNDQLNITETQEKSKTPFDQQASLAQINMHIKQLQEHNQKLSKLSPEQIIDILTKLDGILSFIEKPYSQHEGLAASNNQVQQQKQPSQQTSISPNDQQQIIAILDKQIKQQMQEQRNTSQQVQQDQPKHSNDDEISQTAQDIIVGSHHLQNKNKPNMIFSSRNQIPYARFGESGSSATEIFPPIKLNIEVPNANLGNNVLVINNTLADLQQNLAILNKQIRHQQEMKAREHQIRKLIEQINRKIDPQESKWEGTPEQQGNLTILDNQMKQKQKTQQNQLSELNMNIRQLQENNQKLLKLTPDQIKEILINIDGILAMIEKPFTQHEGLAAFNKKIQQQNRKQQQNSQEQPQKQLSQPTIKSPSNQQKNATLPDVNDQTAQDIVVGNSQPEFLIEELDLQARNKDNLIESSVSQKISSNDDSSRLFSSSNNHNLFARFSENGSSATKTSPSIKLNIEADNAKQGDNFLVINNTLSDLKQNLAILSKQIKHQQEIKAREHVIRKLIEQINTKLNPQESKLETTTEQQGNLTVIDNQMEQKQETQQNQLSQLNMHIKQLQENNQKLLKLTPDQIKEILMNIDGILAMIEKPYTQHKGLVAFNKKLQQQNRKTTTKSPNDQQKPMPILDVTNEPAHDITVGSHQPEFILEKPDMTLLNINDQPALDIIVANRQPELFIEELDLQSINKNNVIGTSLPHNLFARFGGSESSAAKISPPTKLNIEAPNTKLENNYFVLNNTLANLQTNLATLSKQIRQQQDMKAREDVIRRLIEQINRKIDPQESKWENTSAQKGNSTEIDNQMKQKLETQQNEKQESHLPKIQNKSNSSFVQQESLSQLDMHIKQLQGNNEKLLRLTPEQIKEILYNIDGILAIIEKPFSQHERLTAITKKIQQQNRQLQQTSSNNQQKGIEQLFQSTSKAQQKQPELSSNDEANTEQDIIVGNRQPELLIDFQKINKQNGMADTFQNFRTNNDFSTLSAPPNHINIFARFAESSSPGTPPTSKQSIELPNTKLEENSLLVNNTGNLKESMAILSKQIRQQQEMKAREDVIRKLIEQINRKINPPHSNFEGFSFSNDTVEDPPLGNALQVSNNLTTATNFPNEKINNLVRMPLNLTNFSPKFSLSSLFTQYQKPSVLKTSEENKGIPGESNKKFSLVSARDNTHSSTNRASLDREIKKIFSNLHNSKEFKDSSSLDLPSETLSEINRQLNEKRKETLLKKLAKQIKQNNAESLNDDSLSTLELLQKIVHNNDVESKEFTEDTVSRELESLQDAINRLRQIDDDEVDFSDIDTDDDTSEAKALQSALTNLLSKKPSTLTSLPKKNMKKQTILSLRKLLAMKNINSQPSSNQIENIMGQNEEILDISKPNQVYFLNDPPNNPYLPFVYLINGKNPTLNRKFVPINSYPDSVAIDQDNNQITPQIINSPYYTSYPSKNLPSSSFGILPNRNIPYYPSSNKIFVKNPLENYQPFYNNKYLQQFPWGSTSAFPERGYIPKKNSDFQYTQSNIHDTANLPNVYHSPNQHLQASSLFVPQELPNSQPKLEDPFYSNPDPFFRGITNNIQGGGYQQGTTENNKQESITFNPNPQQYPTNTLENTKINEKYSTQKLNEINDHIYNLQNIINTLNKPEYNQKPGDQDTLHHLEAQINNLKGIINGLNGQIDYNGQVNTNDHLNAPEITPNNHNDVIYQNNSPQIAQNSATNITPQQNGDTYFQPKMRSRDKRSINSYITKIFKTPDIKTAQVPDNNAEKPEKYVNRYIKSSACLRHKRSPSIEEDFDIDSLLPFLQNVINKEILEENTNNEELNLYKSTKNTASLNEQLGILKKQLEEKLQKKSQHNVLTSKGTPRYNSPYQSSYYQQPYPVMYYQKKYDVDKKDKKENKKEGFFDKMVTKIIDKVIKKVQIATPRIVEAILGFNYDYNYGSSGYDDNYGSYEVKEYKPPGLLGFFPMIILKIVSNVSYFIKVLQRNRFFKTFLMPALLLLGVAGMIVFLIWWLQPNDQYENSNYYSGNQYGSTYGNIYKNNYNNYQGDDTFNPIYPYRYVNLPNNNVENSMYYKYYKNNAPNTMYMSENKT